MFVATSFILAVSPSILDLFISGPTEVHRTMTLLVQRQPDLKCVVVGDDSVGKTSMLMGYATNRYPTQHVPSVFDNYAGE